MRPGENPDNVLEDTKHRLEVYKEKTIPVLIYFMGKVDVIQVNGNVSIEKVYKQIQEFLIHPKQVPKSS